MRILLLFIIIGYSSSEVFIPELFQSEWFVLVVYTYLLVVIHLCEVLGSGGYEQIKQNKIK